MRYHIHAAVTLEEWSDIKFEFTVSYNLVMGCDMFDTA